MLLGVGGGAGIANLMTPSIVPFISSNFNPNQANGVTNNGLKPNGGAGGAMYLPGSPGNAADSAAFYFEMTVNPALAYAPGLEAAFAGFDLSTNTTPGQPDFFFQKLWNGVQPGSYWWLNTGSITGSGSGATAGSSYATGFYPFTAPTTPSCTGRQPTGIWQPLSTSGVSTLQQLDPGLGCPASTTTLNATAIAANIPGSGAQQATGLAASPAQAATTCVSNSPVSGEMTVTVNLAVAHGVSPGIQYTLQGFNGTGFTGYNATYFALPGTAGTTLVGETSTGGGTCPTSPLDTSAHEGTALSGTGASVTFPGVSSTNPYSYGSTGITTKNNQHICGWLVENGDDSTFPGSQALEMVDQTGTALPGSPAFVPFLNQGTSNFIGSTSGAVLTVTAVNPYTITGATYNATTGFVTFPVSTNPGFVPGSEFTVSGIVTSPASPNLYNQTYVAVSGTSSTQVVGNPISGPVGTLRPFGSSPGTYASGGSLVSVIMPGQTLLPTASIILPYGTSSTTGVGTTGTYALSATPGTPISSSTIFAYPSFYYSAAASGNPAGGVATARTAASIGDFIQNIGGTSTLSPSHAGWGGSLGNFATLWGKIPTQTGGVPSTAALASICTKQTDIQTYAAAQTTAGNPIKVNSLYRLNDLGIWGDSGNATITGYITNSSGTNATLNVVSTPYGSLALATGTETANLTGVGLPVASPVTIPLTTSASSTYAITPNTTGALGSSGSPITFAVGAFKPALPLQSNTFKGYIDTTAGVSTLHVTSLDDGVSHSGFASFTGTLGSSFTASIVPGTGSNGAAIGQGLMVVTLPGGSAPANAYVGIGTLVSPGVGTGSFTPTNVIGIVSGTNGYNGSYIVDVSQTVSSQVMFGSGSLPGYATTLQATGTVIGTILGGMVVTDGGASLTGLPLLVVGGTACPSSNCFTVSGNYYPPISGDATMQATLTTIAPGEYIQNSAITNPVKVVSYGSGAIGLSPGNYVLSGSPNASGAVGSSGSPATFTGTTITDGGAIAPGPALTIDDKGPGITYPVNFSTGLGSVSLSGTYDVPTLGGTPSGIQVLVSNSANGPPITGCTPCNWGTLTGTISGGAWSGTIAGIPGGGPYFVSVRASNGVAYATLPNSIRVGAIYAVWGNGQAASIFGNQSGSNTSWFSGLWGYGRSGTIYGEDEAYLAGPPVSSNFVPAQPFVYAGDRFGVQATGTPFPEALVSFEQDISNSLGVPASVLYPARDGVGMGIYALGNVTQTQTVGSGTGSQTVWCSAAKFCGNVDVGGPLVFNAASLTGVWFSGSVSGSTLTVTTRYGGALEPGMVLGATGSPTVLRCLTSCTTPFVIDGSTWLLSSSSANGATGTITNPLRADPPASLIPFGGATTPWPNLNIQSLQSGGVFGFGGFGWPVVKAGTFEIIDTTTSTVLCQDSQTFAYNQVASTSLGAGCSGFVNYQTGDYEVTLTSAPASADAIIASWTNIISPQTLSNSFNRLQGLDLFGGVGAQTGYVASQFAKFPGGVNGEIWSSQGSDFNNPAAYAGYEISGIGYSQMISWLYGTKFPALIPGASPSVPFMTTDLYRLEGPVTIYSTPTNAKDNITGQWAQDVVTKSTLSGTVASNVLTLSAAAVGPMWEGEILGCVTYSPTACSIGPLSGVYITSLASGAWGASGSSYNLANATGISISSASPMQNAMYYSGSGPTLFLGTVNDVLEYWNSGLSQTTARGVHPGNGFTGGRRATSRWAAMIYGANGGNASDPKVDRVKADAAGCDAAALAAPCFDIGTTYQASFSTATWSGNIVTISGGMAAHARPFVVGQAFNCSGCNSGLVITSLSVPPTQSTVAGAGEVGQTFTFTAKNAAGQAIGGSGNGAVTGGCSGVSGTGSNCIDVAISLNVGGTFGTPAALDTCGANNINGNAPNYVTPSGKCQGNGIGELTRAFRVGTAQLMNGDGVTAPAVGSVFDDGIDLANGHFNQSAAFTCNIVATKVVQCVKGPLYTAGVLTSGGQWQSQGQANPTYIFYGDTVVVSGRIASLLGYVGGQSFPFTPGSGYTNGTQTITATCPTVASGFAYPKFDVTVAGGAIVNVVPANAAGATGLGIGSTCTVPLTALGRGTGGAIATISLAPVEGSGGIGTFNTDSNTSGMFLYDNSGEPGNPLNSFFTNGMGGYFEPGLPVRPFGGFQGAVVSG